VTDRLLCGWQTTKDICKESSSHIECMVRCGVGLMVSLSERAVIQLYHLETLEYLQDINVASAITRTLNGVLQTMRVCVSWIMTLTVIHTVVAKTSTKFTCSLRN